MNHLIVDGLLNQYKAETKESERIIKEIWKLPTPQNRRVYMYIVDEFSYTKIAKVENRSIPTVKESIDRGLENLRKKLKKFYK